MCAMTKAAGPVPQDRENGYEGAPIKPNKVLVGNHPKVCNCKLCSLEYCDCSEEQQGTVKHTAEYWEKKS